MRCKAAAALLVVGLGWACGDSRSPQTAPASNVENSVAAFLKNAERQTETDDQRREIQRALRDLLDKPASELRQMRYADYGGKPDAWRVTELLTHYFVPNPPVALDDERFFQDFRAPEAQTAIRRQLDEVTRALK